MRLNVDAFNVGFDLKNPVTVCNVKLQQKSSLSPHLQRRCPIFSIPMENHPRLPQAVATDRSRACAPAAAVLNEPIHRATGDFRMNLTPIQTHSE